MNPLLKPGQRWKYTSNYSNKEFLIVEIIEILNLNWAQSNIIKSTLLELNGSGIYDFSIIGWEYLKGQDHP